MDDISEKLADLLNNPESLKSMRELAENILGDKSDEKKQTDDVNDSIFGNDFDPAQIGKIMSIMSKLKSGSDDKRSRLLLALKPHLSEPRREKVDTAIKLLKIIDLLPILRESGMFEF